MFEWKDGYTCTIDEIDKQHKKLLEIGARIYQILKSEKKIDKYDDIAAVLKELKEYTIYHFGYEEKLMETNGYSDLEDHKVKHQQFVDKIIDIEDMDIDENQDKAIMEMLMFVADWIEKHILVADMGYVKEFIMEGSIQS